jgi:O-antigen/teichoic acid export membrane protein
MPAHRSDRRFAPTRAEAFFYVDPQNESRRTGVWSSQTSELDAGLYERQMAGIAALFALTTDVVTVTRTGELRRLVEESETQQGGLRVLWARLREDQMTWNSLYLVLNTGLMAGFGFAFWIITAHLFSVTDVGKASGLVSAAGVIGNLAILGLNNGLNRYLPESKNPDGMISSGMALVGTAGAVGAFIYLLLIPVIAPDLSFVMKSPMLVLGFVLITATQAVNTLTDTIFVATRNAKYTALVDGIIGGIGKVVCAFLLAGAGTYGLFAASASGFVLASIASLLLIYVIMQVRLDLRQPLRTLKPLLGFAGANYVGNVFNMIPGLVVPLILLDRLGPKSAAYFFVVFQIVQIVYAAALALEQTFLAEGSRADADMRALRRRSVRMLVMFCTPTALFIIGIGRFLLLAFGGAYASNGFVSLVILCLAAGPIAANYWYLTILRLAGKLRGIIVVSAVYAAGTCSFVWIGAAHGLTGVATGWFFGAFVATCVSVVVARDGRAGSSARNVAPGMAGVKSGYAHRGQVPVRKPGQPRRLLPPVNPFEPRRGGIDPRGGSGRYGPYGNGYQPRLLPPPANQGEPRRGGVDPREVNGRHDPWGSSGRPGPPRTQRPAHPMGPGYDRARPRPVNDRYPGVPNGQYDVDQNEGYGPRDPGSTYRGHTARGNGEKPPPRPRPVNRNEDGDTSVRDWKEE